MAIYRVPSEASFKNYGISRDSHVTIPNEWSEENGQSRIDDPSWIQRYEYEAAMILDICKENKYTKILELGSGPGVLGQHILKDNPLLTYTYVDKQEAKRVFENRNYKGSFFVKDLMNSFDLTGLDSDYDLVIANDFLEHIANPSDVLFKCRSIIKSNGSFFISVPNWRMGHDFIYRGLFDYDNFLYFCTVHGWHPESIFGSPLKCAKIPRQSSEETMPEELLDSWNWYINTKKID
jgi:2-polyprenyl-3-methyl-5-hydroxy-6-metoxy-1,4-benzoquinol methylase